MPSMTRQWGERSFAALRMTLRKKNADLYRSADEKKMLLGEAFTVFCIELVTVPAKIVDYEFTGRVFCTL